MKGEGVKRRGDTLDRQYQRRSDDSDERRIDGKRVKDTIRIQLEKKYETKTKTRVLNGEKETDVKLEHNIISGKGKVKRRYRYPNSLYGLVNNEWRRTNGSIDIEEVTDEENE